MKNKILLALFLSAAIYACNKQTDTAKVNQVALSNKQDALGTLHNKGLRSLLNSAKNAEGNIFSNSRVPSNATGNLSIPSGTPDISTSSLLESSKNIILQDPVYSNQHFVIDPATVTTLDQLINDLGQNSVQNRWTQSVSQQTVIDLVSTRERAMISEITNVFNTSYATNPPVQDNYLTIKGKLAAIRQKYKNTTFLPNEGELFSGLLSIAESSNEYWSGEGVNYVNTIITYDIAAYKNGNPFALITDPVRSQTPFMTGDCIGYLSGWVSAVYSEWHDTGGLSIKNSNYRIGCGLIGAVFGSSGILLKASSRRPFLGVKVSADSLLQHIDTIVGKPVFPAP